MCTSASYRTSVTVVLWKVSLLYTHPWPHGTRSVRLPCSRTSEEKQDESERLKFRLSVPGEEDWFPAAELELSRQRCGGVAPVKMLTIMWKASSTWGKQIHMYKIFWYLPKPPIAERIWSKFIFGKCSPIWRLALFQLDEKREVSFRRADCSLNTQQTINLWCSSESKQGKSIPMCSCGQSSCSLPTCPNPTQQHMKLLACSIKPTLQTRG